MTKEKGPDKGLKKLRGIIGNMTTAKPKFDCSNCGCKRYKPCGCTKGTKGNEK